MFQLAKLLLFYQIIIGLDGICGKVLFISKKSLTFATLFRKASDGPVAQLDRATAF